MHYQTLNILISHAYFIKNKAFIPIAEHLHKKHNVGFMIDSGAVTLKFAKGKAHKELNIISYWEYIENHYKKFSNKFIAFDTIGDAIKSHNQWQETLAKGIKTIPVITNRNSLKHIKEYVASYDYIAVTLQSNDFKLLELAVKEAQLYGVTPRIHVLGHSMGANNMNYKIVTSVDASTWTLGHRFGNFQLLESSFKVKTLSNLKGILSDSKTIMKMSPYMDRYGVTVEDLLSQNGIKTYEHAVTYWNTKTFLDVSERAYRINVQYFFSLTSLSDLAILLSGVCSNTYKEFANNRKIILNCFMSGNYDLLDKLLEGFKFNLINP